MYENQDEVTLLIDGTRFDLGKADYEQNSGGGLTELEILTVPVDVALLNKIANATKVEGSITAERANSLGPFTFGYSDFTLAKNALIILNALKQAPPAQ